MKTIVQCFGCFEWYPIELTTVVKQFYVCVDCKRAYDRVDERHV